MKLSLIEQLLILRAVKKCYLEIRKRNSDSGLCYCFKKIYNPDDSNYCVELSFDFFAREYALWFDGDILATYWWKSYDPNRLKFLTWMIEQTKLKLQQSYNYL